MEAIGEIYCAQAYSHLRPLHATWPTSLPLKLGDYGERRGARFVRFGSIAEFGITFCERTSGGGSSHFSLAKGVSTQMVGGAAAQAETVGAAALTVEFGREYGIFLNAAGCRMISVESKTDLGEALMQSSRFQRNWVVVTDVVHARSFTLAISEEKGAKLLFESKDRGVIDLAKGSAQLTCTHQDRIGYVDCGHRERTPFVGLCGIRTSLLRRQDRLKVFAAGWDKPEGEIEEEPESFVQIE